MKDIETKVVSFRANNDELKWLKIKAIKYNTTVGKYLKAVIDAKLYNKKINEVL